MISPFFANSNLEYNFPEQLPLEERRSGGAGKDGRTKKEERTGRTRIPGLHKKISFIW